MPTWQKPFQFKYVFKYAYHISRKYTHGYLANDQECTVKFWISLSARSRMRDETFSMPDYGIGHDRVNSSPEEKRLSLHDLAVSDILPGIVAQVKREVGSPFLYYSRWITRPLSHSLQFKCNEPHRYIPSYSFSGSPFSPPLTQLISCHPTLLPLRPFLLPPQRDVIPHNPDIFHHYSSGRSDGGQIINFSRN